MNHRIAKVAGCVCVMFCAGLITSSTQAAPLVFARCSSTQAVIPTQNIECATLSVPLNRQDPSAGNVSLAVQRVPASAPQLGTIMLLAGGPGQPALPAFEEALAPLADQPALRGYELASFDQRGTGQSGALTCPGLFRTGLAALAACGEMLGAERADYTSQDSVEDMEDLRRALGGSPLSLFAVSYGGKVAGMYAREYPDGVARMVLDSPVPLAGSDPLDSQRVRALHRVLDAGICGGGACRAFTRDPYGDLVRLVALLHRHPMRARIFEARGRRETVPVIETGVYELLSVSDLASDLRALVPAAVAAALEGDTAPLGRLTSELGAPAPGSAAHGAQTAGWSAPGRGWPDHAIGDEAATPEPSTRTALSVTLFDATLCDESPLPWSPESAPASRAATLRHWVPELPAGTTAPFTVNAVIPTSAAGLCKAWPATLPAPPPPTGVSAVPTLILSGDEDLREPYEQDLTVAAGYSDAQILRIPDTGHSTVGTDQTGCAQHAMIAFLTGGSAPSVCPAPHESQVLPPPPSSLNELHPARSPSTLAGRGATAVAMTIMEVLGQPSLEGGGLRGGSWQLQGTQVKLRRLIDIPGVSVSGLLQLTNSTARLTIRGRVHGTIDVRGIALSGRLNGAEIRARLIR